MKFPKEVGLSRRVVNNIQEYLRFVNLHNGTKKAIFESVYSCNVIDGRANYDDVEIDKLFFDFDSDGSWGEANKLHQYCLKKNIKHKINFSGGGYHIYIFTTPYKAQNTKPCILNSQYFFIDKLKFDCDKQVLGDATRLCRVPNTYNGRRKRFCIPLTQEQFEKGDSFCKTLALKQNKISNNSIGETPLDIKRFDKRVNEPFCKLDLEITNLPINIDINKYPECIKRILSNKNSKWKERYLLILYFKEIGFTRQEVFDLLQSCLSEKKFIHCIGDEKQLQYLFERDDLMFPNCDKIMVDGICPGKCEEFNKVIYK